MTTNLNAPTDVDDEVGLADWLEAVMLVEQRAYISRAKIRRYMRSLFADDQPDVAVDVVLQEVARRQRVCKEAYPFSEDGSGMRFSRSDAGTPYLFMLCISISKPYRDEHRFTDTDELFDTVILDALLQYLGPGAEGVRFAAPASGERPKNFQEGIQWLAQKMKLPAGKGRPRRTGGDGGLDVVAWRPFRDRRSGFIVLMAQCTVQRDWIGKAKDLNEDIWRGWVDLGKDPHFVLAIPYVISATYEKWDELRRLVHTGLDRLRISELLDGVQIKAEPSVKRWVAKEVSRMGGAS